ncbi:MAG: metallophosphoesterase family protein [Enterococcus gallinarum]
MRFLHSADLHIDRSFEGIRMLSDNVKEQLPLINRKIIKKLVDTALEHEVDFVLLAGDTFHQARPSLRIQHDFFQEISRLASAEIPVYMIFGNHDYYDPQRYWFDFPENVVLFPSETVETIKGVTRNGETYAISGFSYQQPWITQNKIREFPNRQAVDFHIGMYHGDSAGEHYAPFSVSEMKQKGYDYWALGHIHVPKILSEEPAIVYPGTPQGKTQKEQDTGVVLATLSSPGTEIQTVDVAEITWAQQEVSLAACKDQRSILQTILKEVNTNQPRLIKLVLTDTDQLSSDWFSETEKNEMIAYLNEQLSRDVLQTIYAIEVYKTETDKIPLAIPASYVDQLLAIYQDSSIFAEGLNDLLRHPLLYRGIDQGAFQEEVLQQTKHLLENDFQWEEEV